MDKQRNVAPSSKILMIPIVILSIIGIAILVLIIMFFLSLQDTVYPLPIGPILEMQTEDTSIPFRITPALVKIPTATVMLAASMPGSQML